MWCFLRENDEQRFVELRSYGQRRNKVAVLVPVPKAQSTTQVRSQQDAFTRPLMCNTQVRTFTSFAPHNFEFEFAHEFSVFSRRKFQVSVSQLTESHCARVSSQSLRRAVNSAIKPGTGYSFRESCIFFAESYRCLQERQHHVFEICSFHFHSTSYP